MRCLACDENLNNKESTRKFLSGEYVDLCDHCFETIKDQVMTIETDPPEDDEILDE